MRTWFLAAAITMAVLSPLSAVHARDKADKQDNARASETHQTERSANSTPAPAPRPTPNNNFDRQPAPNPGTHPNLPMPAPRPTVQPGQGQPLHVSGQIIQAPRRDQPLHVSGRIIPAPRPEIQYPDPRPIVPPRPRPDAHSIVPPHPQPDHHDGPGHVVLPPRPDHHDGPDHVILPPHPEHHDVVIRDVHHPRGRFHSDPAVVASVIISALIIAEANRPACPPPDPITYARQRGTYYSCRDEALANFKARFVGIYTNDFACEPKVRPAYIPKEITFGEQTVYIVYCPQYHSYGFWDPANADNWIRYSVWEDDTMVDQLMLRNYYLYPTE